MPRPAAAGLVALFGHGGGGGGAVRAGDGARAPPINAHGDSDTAHPAGHDPSFPATGHVEAIARHPVTSAGFGADWHLV